MSITQLLFSFNGRINRAKWWLTGLAILACMIALMLVGLAAGALVGLAIIIMVLYIPMLWIGLAVGAKRLHDRDKSAWWLLVFYVLPGVLQAVAGNIGALSFILNLVAAGISIWGIVELGFLRGTDGSNQYGPDPLQQA